MRKTAPMANAAMETKVLTKQFDWSVGSRDGKRNVARNINTVENFKWYVQNRMTMVHKKRMNNDTYKTFMYDVTLCTISHGNTGMCESVTGQMLVKIHVMNVKPDDYSRRSPLWDYIRI